MPGQALNKSVIDQRPEAANPRAKRPVSTKYKAGIALLQQKHEGIEVLLVQQTNGRWSLPKGKRKAGETLKESCLRECREETGREPETLEFVGWGANTHKGVRFYLWKSEAFRWCPPDYPAYLRRDKEILRTAWVALAQAGEMLKSWQANLLAKAAS